MLIQGSRTLEMTGYDEFLQPLYVEEITYSGYGMTAGQHITLTDADGNLIADQKIINASENGFLLQAPQWMKGIKAAQMPGGTISVIIRFA